MSLNPHSETEFPNGRSGSEQKVALPYAIETVSDLGMTETYSDLVCFRTLSGLD
jgi:hypothetical protein